MSLSTCSNEAFRVVLKKMVTFLGKRNSWINSMVIFTKRKKVNFPHKIFNLINISKETISYSEFILNELYDTKIF